MSELIQTVTDKNQFEKIFYEFFLKSGVHLKSKSGDVKIAFFGYSGGMAAFKIPFLQSVPESCIIYTRKETSLIYCHLKYAEKQEEDLYLFHPLQFQFISAARREDRMDINAAAEGKRILTVTGLITDFIIQNSLAMETRKVDNIREMVQFGLEKQFKYIKTYFCNEGMSDVRLRYFYDNKMPIFMPDFNAKPEADGEKSFNFYMNNIYSKDYLLFNRRLVISEISVPVLYKTMIPCGYIQVNGITPMSGEDLGQVKKVAAAAEEQFRVMKVFPAYEEKLLVSDISKKGLGIVFKERRLIRYFKENSSVFFNLQLPQGKKAAVLAVVRNISLMDNKVIKIGCQIREMDALSEVHYEEFLASAGLPQGEENITPVSQNDAAPPSGIDPDFTLEDLDLTSPGDKDPE